MMDVEQTVAELEDSLTDEQMAVYLLLKNIRLALKRAVDGSAIWCVRYFAEATYWLREVSQ